MNVNDIKLFPHNQDTYNKIQEAWKTSNRVASVQATGTGKSYLILKCLYNEADKNKIVLAPSNYILEQLESEAGEVLPNTILMTYSKLSFMTDEEIQSLDLSLVIMDEFHRCGAEQWGTGVQKLIDIFPNAKILGTSATNIRFLDNNRDMADELFDGNVVTNLNLAEAIVRKIVSMPKYVSALYTFNDEVEILKNKVNNSKNSDEEKEELLKEIDKMKNKLDKSKGIPKILKKHLDISNDKFIIFCKDNAHLIEMKKVVIEWFKKAKIFKSIKTYIAYSGYNNTDKEVENFMCNKNENEVKLLFTIDMFNEGVHIKDISGVILLRPTTSPIIYYQQIGRAIQAGKKSESVILDFVNNFDNIGAKNFTNDLKESLKQQKESTNNDKDNNNQIDDFEFMIFDEIQEAKILFENIEEKLNDNWDYWYEQLKNFYIKNGHSNVLRIKNNDEGLQKWVANQRYNYNKGLLNCEKIEKLEKLSFLWNVSENKWECMFILLEQYKYKNKNINISSGLIFNNQKLGKWLSAQKLKYQKNKLSKEKIEKLEKLGIIWNNTVKDIKWYEMFEYLEEYKNIFGNIFVPKKYKTSDNRDLYLWLHKQKKKFQNNELDDDKALKLKLIGINLTKEKEHDIKWNEMYKALVEYKKINNNLLICKDYVTKDGKNLGVWCVNQRFKYNKGILSEERIQNLNKIGFPFVLKK